MDGGLQSRLRNLSSVAVFVGELIANPRSIGAPVPSSRALARSMASFIPSSPQGTVVELGPGTGVVTSALLERGIPPEKLVLIERSREMIKILKRKFPGMKIIFGDAAQLTHLLAPQLNGNGGVSHVVSSLPLRSLPKPVVADIARELGLVLGNGGRFIQFTYDLHSDSLPALRSFKRQASKMVWLNLPPARVDLFHVA